MSHPIPRIIAASLETTTPGCANGWDTPWRPTATRRKLSLDSSDLARRVSGWELMQRGVSVRLEMAQSSELLLLERVE